LIEAEYLVGTAQRVPQRGGLGGNDLQWLAVGTGGVQPEIQSALAFGQPLARGSLSASTSPSSWAEPRCSIWREPRRVDHTICTAVAPEEVFTVRTYATNAPYEATASAQICTRTTVKTQVNELQNPPTRNSDKSQVRLADFRCSGRAVVSPRWAATPPA